MSDPIISDQLSAGILPQVSSKHVSPVTRSHFPTLYVNKAQTISVCEDQLYFESYTARHVVATKHTDDVVIAGDLVFMLYLTLAVLFWSLTL